MFGVEHVVDRRQADILVDAAVAGDEVRVEQLVVVFGVAIARGAQANGDIAVGNLPDRHGLMGDVREESVTGAKGSRNRRVDRAARRSGDDDIVSRVRDAVSTNACDHLRVAGRIGDEIAILVGSQERHGP